MPTKLFFSKPIQLHNFRYTLSRAAVGAVKHKVERYLPIDWSTIMTITFLTEVHFGT